MLSEYEYKNEFSRTHVEKGKALGRVEQARESTLLVLEARDIETSDEVLERIMRCTDLGQLEIWFDRAITAATADELFD